MNKVQHTEGQLEATVDVHSLTHAKDTNQFPIGKAAVDALLALPDDIGRNWIES